MITGLFWCPKKFREVLDLKVKEIGARRNIDGPQIVRVDSFDEETYARPTYIESNSFMYPFQEIVNTYGVPLYKEVNPAPFASVTFPFLFGVMFGDVFHGLILTVFAIVLCFKTF